MASDVGTNISWRNDSQKGLMGLPAELRIKVYEHLLLPSPHCQDLCGVKRLDGSEMACTRQKAETRLLGMDIVSIYESGSHVRRGSSAISSGKCAILRTSRQVFRESSAVLYENVRLDVCPCRWKRFSYDTYRVLKQVCPAYASQYIKTIHIHLDIRLRDNTERLDACAFECLYAIANEVEFVVDVHIYCAFYDDGSGWGEEVYDDECREEDWHHRFWAQVKGVAFEIRREFIEDLGRLFARNGKELRMKDSASGRLY